MQHLCEACPGTEPAPEPALECDLRKTRFTAMGAIVRSLWNLCLSGATASSPAHHGDFG